MKNQEKPTPQPKPQPIPKPIPQPTPKPPQPRPLRENEQPLEKKGWEPEGRPKK